MTRHGIALAALAILAGCSTTPAPQPRPVVVDRIVQVECREERPQRPALPSEFLQASDGLHAKVMALLAEIELRDAYEIRLAAALDNCRRPIQPQGTAGGQ